MKNYLMIPVRRSWMKKWGLSSGDDFNGIKRIKGSEQLKSYLVPPLPEMIKRSMSPPRLESSTREPNRYTFARWPSTPVTADLIKFACSSVNLIDAIIAVSPYPLSLISQELYISLQKIITLKKQEIIINFCQSVRKAITEV